MTRIRTDDDSTIAVWYGGEPLARLLADVDTLAQGLVDGAVLRVRTDQPEAWTAMPALCQERGYRLIHQSDTWEGVTEIALMGEFPAPPGPYRFDIVAKV